MSRTDEMLVMLLSQTMKLHATIEAFISVWLRLQLGQAKLTRESAERHPTFESFVNLQTDLICSFVNSISAQFPELEKLIKDHVEVALDDLAEDFANEDDNGKGPR